MVKLQVALSENLIGIGETTVVMWSFQFILLPFEIVVKIWRYNDHFILKWNIGSHYIFDQKRVYIVILILIHAILFTDKEAPVIECPANQTVKTEPNQAHASVFWTAPQVTDNSQQIAIITVTCGNESGSQFEIGKTEISCQAVDAAGNQATCTFAVKVEGNEHEFRLIELKCIN